MLGALWRFRHFIAASILGELRGRYARSKLGLLWSILHPLAQAAIFALVLAEVLGAKLDGIDDQAAYPMYLLAGMSAWTLFSEILNRCLTVFVEYSGTLKKIAFPRLCLPVIVFGSAIVNHLLLLLAIAIVFLFFGRLPGVTWLVLPLGILLIAMFAFGLGVILGLFNVFTRDVGQIMAVVFQLWFWLTPIVYPRSVVPDHLRWALELNPMAALVDFYHDALVFERWPDLTALIVPSLLALSLFALAFVLFRRASPELVDAL